MQKREKFVGEIAEKLVSFRFGKKILRYDIEYSVQVFLRQLQLGTLLQHSLNKHNQV